MYVDKIIPGVNNTHIHYVTISHDQPLRTLLIALITDNTHVLNSDGQQFPQKGNSGHPPTYREAMMDPPFEKLK